MSTSSIAQVKIKKSGTGTYYYFDEDGNEIFPQKRLSGYIGDSYSESYIQIPDYEYLRTEGENSGQFSEESKKVYFYYKSTAIPTIITIKYVDRNGVELHEDVTIDVFVNDTINLLDNTLKIKQESKKFYQKIIRFLKMKNLQKNQTI